MTKSFGLIKAHDADTIKAKFHQTDVIYSAMFDRQAMWDPATIDRVLDAFPKKVVDDNDLFLILAECIANAVLHGQAEVLGFQARRRGDVVLLSFLQIPPMQERVSTVLDLARKGQMKECTAELPGGLGFPILLKLVKRITVTSDFSRLQLWMRASTQE